ncbi:G-type lectin S-receptor-like serine/threonine-protein kinase At1g11300 isoform X2 [Trifolium pratense]|uniref:G-type lectin S-receptor-like serine/threonine-protein kinase At1g11300 isoform X2 n=1 Tax=Trifolium pratense TaxID=57577 RepID=UPI001E695AD7|nr:G-type lectin S-receptor-like serine/threonine-protein kinase At1g11300 isoform X2 [Trifolium pratense]
MATEVKTSQLTILMDSPFIMKRRNHLKIDFNNYTNMFLFFILSMLCFDFIDVSVAIDTITSTQFIKDPETLSSKSGNFTLGFFSPENSTNRYVGIWWQPQFTVVSVLNRDQPLKDSSGVVKISDDGNDLVVLNGKKEVIWTSDVPNIATNSSSILLDSGNLVLVEGTTGKTIWESFEHPSNVMLPNMKLTGNKITGEKVKLTSWKTPFDPSIGSFTLSVERLLIPEVFIWNETRPYWRTGPWNGKIFTGVPNMKTHYLSGIRVIDDGEGNVLFFEITTDTVGLIIYNLTSEGNCEEKWWDEKKKEWKQTSNIHETECDIYGVCGTFASCNSQNSPICSCLKGFEPKNKEEWNRQNWTGCVRRTPLQQCERERNQNTSADKKADGFLKLQMVKVPDFADGSSLTLSSDTCRNQCLENCSCVAYSYDADIGCMSWSGNLVDIQQFSNGGLYLYIRVAHTELDKERNITVIIIITVIAGTVLVLACAYIMWRRISNKHARNRSGSAIGELSQVKLQELLLLDLGKLATATNNFHSSNKLGQGGFGPVYKGTMHDGQEIAVKRLSKSSGQGQAEFMNEVAVISKLQHRNLVRLLGCCVEGEEKMLIYEYMPNKSLDVFLFDTSKSKILDWSKRFSIIEGIARGLLYLHRDSRLKIIHRDLKPSNILLDNELNPKISDFGMARIFGGNEDQENTRRVVGTYGYMSPEYAMQGLFSDKSDVFSFGVLLLEIISGRRNSKFYDCENSLTLLGFVWIQWTEDNILSLIDPEIYDPIHYKYMFRSIHIGLLCVQEFSIDRPTMAAVTSMLNSEILDLPPPKKPAFILRQNMLSSLSSDENNDGLHSINLVSISDLQGR